MLGNTMSVLSGYTIRIEGFLDASTGEVWSCLVQPRRLADWLGEAEVEPWPRGRFRLHLDGGESLEGTVLALEPQRCLAVRCPEVALRFDLTAVAGGTRLAFQISLPPEGDVAQHAALWHARLDRVSAVLKGVPMPDMDARISQLRTSYKALGEAATAS
jgi:uncharacterized protein YndB with AHSA1/START domain